MIVVSDASPINALVRIGHLDILFPLFNSVLIPPAVASELSHSAAPSAVRNVILSLPKWLEIRAPLRIDISLSSVDAGEAEAISLALELNADILLADDRKARLAARDRGLVVTGAVGVLELASVRGLLNLQDAFSRLRSTDFRVAEHVLRDALERDAARRSKS